MSVGSATACLAAAQVCFFSFGMDDVVGISIRLFQLVESDQAKATLDTYRAMQLETFHTRYTKGVC